jgi:hypothetical protein
LAVRLAFGISGLGSQVLAHISLAGKPPKFSQIMRIVFIIDVFQTFDITAEVFIFELQNADQKVS